MEGANYFIEVAMMLVRDCNFSFVWCKRNSNVCTHFVAKHASLLPNSQTPLAVLPSILRNLVWFDCPLES